MRDITITNAEGKQININNVRYFRLNGIEYLIFSLNEIDDVGYVKLYVSKIVDGTGKTIDDDVEWNLIKDTIKTVIKSNKDNLPLPIIDLNSDKINNIQIMDQKIFKLNDSLLQLLVANKKEEVYDIPQSNSLDVNSSFDEIQKPQENIDNNFNNPDMQDHFVPSSMESSNENMDFNSMINGSEFVSKLNEFDNDANNQIPDYKALYEEQLNKNNELIKNVQDYKVVIDELKKILNNNI